MLRLGFVAMLVFSVLTACGGDETRERVNFRQGSGSLTVPAEGAEAVALRLTAADTSFFGPANAGETSNALELSLRSADNSLWLSLHLLNVHQTRIYALDSDKEGRLTILIGESCDGGMGDLLGNGCRWYSSDFFHADCWAALETINGNTIEGHIKCRGLGANCPAGTGARTAMGACADGERHEPISLTATFYLGDPSSVLMAANLTRWQ
jgi:hypothetical protein